MIKEFAFKNNLKIVPFRWDEPSVMLSWQYGPLNRSIIVEFKQKFTVEFKVTAWIDTIKFTGKKERHGISQNVSHLFVPSSSSFNERITQKEFNHQLQEAFRAANKLEISNNTIKKKLSLD